MSSPTVKPGNPSVMSGRERFRHACSCEKTDRPPIWLMRQAGRALPEYRALKEKYSFLELVQTPELAAEVTLQPIRRFGFDAAILFSDILVIPEAMGQPYRFRESGGIAMDFALQSRADIERLSTERVVGKLRYATEALRLLRKELGNDTALIGFCGSPWTLATFMMEGGSAEKYTRTLALFREEPRTYRLLAEKLTTAVSDFLRMQIDAGADAVQIFDSHGGQLPANEFKEASGRWLADVVSLTPIKDIRPFIVFSPGTHHNWADLVATHANVIGIDWQFPLAEARQAIPENIALQGNLAPSLLSDATPEVVVRETRAVLDAMQGRKGHIFNLGHGLTPGAKLENISAMVETVKSFRSAD